MNPTENKIFEVRDRATTIPVLVTKINSDDTHVGQLIERAGYGLHPLYYQT